MEACIGVMQNAAAFRRSALLSGGGKGYACRTMLPCFSVAAILCGDSCPAGKAAITKKAKRPKKTKTPGS